MNHLIIVAHPNNQSFNKAITDAVVESSREMGAETLLRDLYSLDFNPVLSWEELQAAGCGIIPSEIRNEQLLISKADLITLIYPLWWMGFPAILKGYLDRVLTHGFAYKTEGDISVGLIQGKKMQQLITIGSNVEQYQSLGFDKSLNDCLINGLFNYCGITDIQYRLFGDIHLIDEQARADILLQARQITKQNLNQLQHNQTA